MKEIAVKRLTETALLPVRASSAAAGYDLFADLAEPVEIAPGCTEMISTGLSMEIPEGYFGAIFARSGLAVKEGLRPANCVGVVDADYRGPFMVGLHNDSKNARLITPGERIAQLVVIPCLDVTFRETDTLSDTVRGEGGFGSTGKQ